MMNTLPPISLASFAKTLRPLRSYLFFALAAAAIGPQSRAQTPHQLITTAANNELAANKADHSAWQYYDHDVTPDHDTLSYTVETPQGDLHKLIQDHGRTPTPDQRASDDQRRQNFLNDRAAQQKARNNSSHDGNQADDMLRLLPDAYIWTIATETPTLITLNFKPDPNYSAKSFEARVLGAMAGQLVLDRAEMRIVSIKGTLVDDVNLLGGLLARLRKGGTFGYSRREVGPGHWQMVTSTVHINGHALFFKTIGSDEDESRSDFKPSPAQTLQQANEILKEIR